MARRPLHPEMLALLQAVKERPDEDAPRLLLADWLEEHGDADERARADLIRMQIALERKQTLPGMMPSELRRREAEHRRRYRDAWLAPFRELGEAVNDHWYFRRGLLYANFEAEHFPEALPPALANADAWAWMEEMTLFRTTNARVERFAAWPCLTHLRKLTVWFDFHFEEDCSPGISALASSPHLHALRSLQLWCHSRRQRAAAVFRSPSAFPGLRTLRLSGSTLSGAEAVLLADAPLLEHLTKLDIAASSINDEGAEALARSTRLGQLEDFRLGFNDIGATGALALAQATGFPSLRSLHLGGNPLGPIGGRALASASWLDRLTELDIGNQSLTTDGILALLAAPRLPSGLSLDIGSVTPRADLDVPALRSIAASPGLGRLRKLNLSGHLIGPAGIEALLASPYLVNLEELDLGDNALGPAGLRVLLSWPFPPCLKRLRLSGNNLGEEGGRLLAQSPQMAQIRTLDVSGHHDQRHARAGLTVEGARALAFSPDLGNLEELSLYYCNLDTESQQLLSESPNLSGLFRLWMSLD